MENLDLRLSRLKPRVAVIGAGWAGLAAATELAGLVELTVIEAGREPGGRARCSGAKDARFDNGQHILLGAYAESLRLMRKVGADPERLLRRLPLQWRRQGGLNMRCPRLPAPLHLALGLFFARGMGWRDKRLLLKALRALQQSRYRLRRDCSVAAWLKAERQSEALIRGFWRPLVLSALNTPLEQASMQVLATTLRDSLGADRAASDLLLPACDLSALFPEPAWRWLGGQGARLHASCRVASVQHQQGLPCVDGVSYDAVVLAVAPYHVASLLDNAALRDILAHYSYWPIVTVYLQFADAPRFPAPMMGVEGGMADWLFDREALAGERGWISAVISAPEALPSQDGLMARVAQDVRKIAPHLGMPLQGKVIIEKRATFASTVGLKRPEAGLAGPKIYLAGDWAHPDYPATLEGAARSGVTAARAALLDLGVTKR
ncbi:hydroxysqualene dehydroxylase HpnE [Chromobacterium sp. IIBBL 290-4]|uniref:hydroxysqualene dehydroxylase HpnE n=1 Tax=Chromobacterium sp. IIBBL 290-4 TaxID=2953890 RepID=UPI0020B8940B|nr:hydroxysqualene dehydroxylase HpnE [Chromobacterium sp. IIBBL 290-4]UTH73108.1 hydroxysqualene dehydroxylase HpnE [Chromobacterium sp. IIBBL 290-4]